MRQRTGYECGRKVLRAAVTGKSAKVQWGVETGQNKRGQTFAALSSAKHEAAARSEGAAALHGWFRYARLCCACCFTILLSGTESAKDDAMFTQSFGLHMESTPPHICGHVILLQMRYFHKTNKIGNLKTQNAMTENKAINHNGVTRVAYRRY